MLHWSGDSQEQDCGRRQKWVNFKIRIPNHLPSTYVSKWKYNNCWTLYILIGPIGHWRDSPQGKNWGIDSWRSFAGEYGVIRYDLEGLLVVTQNKIDNSQISINIFAPIDIDSFSPSLHKAAKLTIQKDLIGICGRSGQISSVVQLERKVFLCGETINMNVSINNGSGDN